MNLKINSLISISYL